MRFGTMPVEEARGAVLAHAVAAPGGPTFKKGRVLSAADVADLRERGVVTVVATRLDQGDVPEDEAAARLAAAVAGPGVRAGAAFTGRVNLFATARGLLVTDAARVDRLNARDEAITLATLPAFAVVDPGRMVATVKIIPFAAPAGALADCVAVAGDAEQPLLRVAPFRRLRYRLIQTVLPGTSAKMLDKTSRVTAERVAGVGGELAVETRCPHETAPLAAELGRDDGADVVLVVGASAIADRRDVIPAAVEAAGGRVRHFGMPVDPGNLLLLAERHGRPVIGLPGCARSPKANGFDWVLERLAAGIEVAPSDITRMGVGGLLSEIPDRPQPREKLAEASAVTGPNVAALVLAAGSSRRMGERNKLLIEVDGQPMVRRAVLAALDSGVREVVVVTGHQRERVEATLADLPVRYAHNPEYADGGLSSSLKAGVGALGDDLAGALVCLGDMPRVTSAHLRRLLGAFGPASGGRAIVVPTHAGKRGNPVLWSSAYFHAMRELEGDVGARHLIAQHAADVVEVELDDDAPLLDVDTPEALARLLRREAPVPA
ncbi:MAG TPA: molybdopterin-binding/glycosyltransferase family 2 protein [Geminicoccaceae bacterium]